MNERVSLKSNEKRRSWGFTSSRYLKATRKSRSLRKERKRETNQFHNPISTIGLSSVLDEQRCDIPIVSSISRRFDCRVHRSDNLKRFLPSSLSFSIDRIAYRCVSIHRRRRSDLPRRSMSIRMPISIVRWAQ